MPLVLEIEHLLGVAFATTGPESADPDWPPQPDRVFSALVAAWASRGGLAEERDALEWLEQQDAPLVQASSATARPAPASFVPPNDKMQVTANVAWRTRQPRRFPAALPFDPIVRLIWADARDAPLEALDAMARDVAYVGHSASLTRCRFSESEVGGGMSQPARRIYRGRLRELEVAFQAGRRPSLGEIMPRRRVQPLGNANAFSFDWLTFEIVGGDLDLRAAPLACKALIKAVMSGYEASAGRDSIPAWVSGHSPDRSPSKDAHLAAVPLAFVGFDHSDGALMGLALVPPSDRKDILSDKGFRTAMLEATDSDEEGRRILRLVLGKAGALDLALSFDVDRASLDPKRYTRASRRWATVTPLVLDRHIKGGSAAEQQAEIESQVAEACGRSLGIRPARVVVGKHPALNGAPAAYPSGKAPRWMGWRVPEALSSRGLTHAILEFDMAIAGPVLIGAGRFCGLGLCLPLGVETR